MSNPSDIHQFRTQTPSFILNSNKGMLELSNMQQQGIIVEQLRREALMPRINVSVAVLDLQSFTLCHQKEDYLLMGFSPQTNNPFREKSPCAVL
ncbi:guanine nucleotide-binding protein subunit gamma-1-like [Tigriopus californicus]|uniref:guanine nucleotide-binding protein subunit gamma-1-like n=1 Tax=Tigriopus californicus TaxID=6832 RepID=UPI0027DA83BD|nr:guanine nucleotide-binding protein subunit gamma-1-like [Tigriopus californicus]